MALRMRTLGLGIVAVSGLAFSLACSGDDSPGGGNSAGQPGGGNNAGAAMLPSGGTHAAGTASGGNTSAGNNGNAGNTSGGTNGAGNSAVGNNSGGNSGGSNSSGNSSGGSAGNSSGGAGGTSAATASPGCSMAAGQALGSWVEQPKMNVAGTDRQWWVWLPTGYDPMKAYPLVFNFHGCSSSDNIVPMQKVAGDKAVLVRATGISADRKSVV